MADTLTLTLSLAERKMLSDAINVAIDESRTVAEEVEFAALLARVNGLGSPSCCDTCGEELFEGQTYETGLSSPAEFEQWCGNKACPSRAATPWAVRDYRARAERRRRA